MTKLEYLREILGTYPSAAVAYSGGADSAFLTDVCHEVLGKRMVAVTAISESLAPSERAAAASLAIDRGWRHVEISTREIDRPEYRANDGSRCYYCKDELFSLMGAMLERLGAAEMLCGTNVDDLGDYRPGGRAADERGVRTPLVEAGFTKAEIRAASRLRGLPTWDKPASPCLSSRIAYGVEVTPERLARIARAEELVRSLGFLELRVRDLGGDARVEVPSRDVARLASGPVFGRIREQLQGLGFDAVSVDQLRSGSLNVALGMPVRRTS